MEAIEELEKLYGEIRCSSYWECANQQTIAEMIIVLAKMITEKKKDRWAD